MNNYGGRSRKRGKSLLIVEGRHEKENLFWLMFRCFPEMDIDMDHVWIYGTNIYMLYRDIEAEYGDNWDGEDIDLPFVISKKKNFDELCYKYNFKNIIMVFDYERHDPNFSEEKILKMQRYFADAADMGKLYINYPMLESYQHLLSLPDASYAGRKISVSLQPGDKYKALVRDESVIAGLVEFPHRIDDLLKGRFQISDEQERKQYCNMIFDISDETNLDAQLQNILCDAIEYKDLQTAKYQIKDKVIKSGYAQDRQTYWGYMREVFRKIIYHNICKASQIQNHQYQINAAEYRRRFEELDLAEILGIQNRSSRDADTGFIWVLNTCVFLVAEYNFSFVSFST